MDRLLLVISTFCFMFGFGYTMHAIGARTYRRNRLNLVMLLIGFLFQTAFLYVRGQAVGRCPLTNTFEVITFFCWSMVLFYLLIGPAYRLSLLGVFTSPLVFLLQVGALLMPPTPVVRAKAPLSAWLELHAAVSVVAYGAFALACVAGVMYLAQERQLKTHQFRSIFYHLPPIHDLAVANSRLILTGFLLFTLGLFAGVMHGPAHLHVLRIVSVVLWVVYGLILVATFWHRISPRKVALLSVGTFGVMLLTLWSVQLLPKEAAL